jgi:5-oxopent-3-ene-1,2,5-tricarboxylate decarboxylase/2-hydroxyhepta-2,4-diene-1,7-dioate isomerase
MRGVRFAADGRLRSGRAEGEGRGLVLLDEAGRAFRPDEVIFLPPVEPRAVIGIALNYRDHAAELSLAEPEAPALFLKPPQSLIGHGGRILYPQGAQYMHYEAELAVVIGQPARAVGEAEALSHVRGYTIANDVTVRDFVQNVFRPPTKAKGFDTFCPLGPWLVEGEIDDPQDLAIRTLVNGREVQSGSTRDMVHGVAAMIAYVSAFVTLMPGDVLLTGTPKGISPIHAGDRVRIEIDGIGALENLVAEDVPG